MLRITAYADRLVDDLDHVDWPDALKTMQRNWIGRSEGALVDFTLDDGSSRALRVFTTRADTIFGATYIVLSPEHPLVTAITTPEARAAVDAYRAEAAAKGDAARQADARAKTGVFTGGHAINPATGARIPIWIADYVLAGYGTGAIMAVPGHDERDGEFARAFGLPIKAVAAGRGGGGGPPVRGRRPGRAAGGLRRAHRGFPDRVRRLRPRHRVRERRGAPGWAGQRDGQADDHLLAGGQGARPAAGPVQAAGLAVLAPTVLGRAVSDPARPGWRDPAGR
jgi:hypothetical protein